MTLQIVRSRVAAAETMFLTLYDGANRGKHASGEDEHSTTSTVRHPCKTEGLTSTAEKELPVKLRTTGLPTCFVPKVKGEKIAECACQCPPAPSSLILRIFIWFNRVLDCMSLNPYLLIHIWINRSTVINLDLPLPPVSTIGTCLMRTCPRRWELMVMTPVASLTHPFDPIGVRCCEAIEGRFAKAFYACLGSL
jgi:hypothetical protein